MARNLHLRCGGQLGDRNADDAVHQLDTQPRQRVRHQAVTIPDGWAAAAAGAVLRAAGAIAAGIAVVAAASTCMAGKLKVACRTGAALAAPVIPNPGQMWTRHSMAKGSKDPPQSPVFVTGKQVARSTKAVGLLCSKHQTTQMSYHNFECGCWLLLLP
jgi:hypothetical protein